MRFDQRVSTPHMLSICLNARVRLRPAPGLQTRSETSLARPLPCRMRGRATENEKGGVRGQALAGRGAAAFASSFIPITRIRFP
eukprot:634603-Rhodomonas_salina.1